MGRSLDKSKAPTEWARSILELHLLLNLSQTAFGDRLHCSAMAVSRWERGVREPPVKITGKYWPGFFGGSERHPSPRQLAPGVSGFLR